MNKLLLSQRGMTLIELLLSIVLSSIVLAVVYSLFATGFELYQKVKVEAELRDDADYIATMVMNEFYENSPRTIENWQSQDGKSLGIQLVRAGEKYVEEYIVEDQPQKDLLIDVYFTKEQQNKNTLHIRRKNSNTDHTVEIDTPHSSILDEDPKDNLSKSIISVGTSGRCLEGKCSSGTIEMTLVLQSNKKGIAGSFIKRKPITFKSSFGF
ncbi:PilW family protein [Bacillus testis]|uniref:PilW family protein n=1 Tax=Bacillus testis TaxID=1622072 RepID=UPI00067E775E|nr:prepilin-type N-terminal cleavage/methylation domain-containing protein [Bacillus testis]